MAVSKPHKDSLVWMSGSYDAKDLLLKRAVVKEAMSTLTETTIEFTSKNKAVKLEDLVGKTMTVHVKTAKDNERKFIGTCVSAEYMGISDGYSHFVAEVRPWPWFLTRTQDCRIFQDMDAVEIIKKIFADLGFSDFTDKLTETREKRVYCVQYRETDFDFISRLMEEEGIYYFFDHEGSTEKMVLSDGISAHKPVPEESALLFMYRDTTDRRRLDHVAEWSGQENVTRGKVTLNDFDFLSPSADLKVSNAIKKGKHSHGTYEIYDYPGHYRKLTSLGTTLARIRMEAEAIQHRMWRGAGSVRTLATGYTFTLKEHPSTSSSEEFLVTDATHYIQLEGDYDKMEQRQDIHHQGLPFPDNDDMYSCVFGACPKKEQFRAPLITPWPEIAGLHTATVVGKSGEEIWTDEHGRIKVQFHWDREGKDDENSSCWVRVVTPWSGKNWGMIAIPRMGQEVVIQFEEGDPDRPICTGMLYNKETMPPYALPENQTQSGVKTNSSKGGGGFNELMFEDKKDKELVRFQAEKDYQQIVKNNADITIGVEKNDKGDLTQTVKNNVTETINDGDHTFTIETGSQVIAIKTDKTQTIEGKHTKTITGNDATTVKTGNMTVDVSSGKITMTAAIEIKLVVGGSSIKIDNSGVTIKGPMINITGDAMAEMKSPLTTVKADGILTLKGGLTLIN